MYNNFIWIDTNFVNIKKSLLPYITILFITLVANYIFILCAHIVVDISFMHLSFKSCRKWKMKLQAKNTVILSLYLPIKLILLMSSISSSYSLMLFVLAWRTLFSISCKTNMLTSNSFSFYLSEECLNFSFIFEEKFFHT